METLFAILELILFFIIFPISFKILMAIHIPNIFKKYAVWQIQLFIIFMSVIMAYLFTRAIVHLLELSALIFT